MGGLERRASVAKPGLPGRLGQTGLLVDLPARLVRRGTLDFPVTKATPGMSGQPATLAHRGRLGGLVIPAPPGLGNQGNRAGQARLGLRGQPGILGLSGLLGTLGILGQRVRAVDTAGR